MAAETTNSGDSSPLQLCLVCGDRSSGRHYGVMTCDGCRGFFKRSVRRCMGYVCRENNRCVVDLGRRNQCQACRLRKCLNVGMRREAVQNERAPRNKKESAKNNSSFPPYPTNVVYRRVPISSADVPASAVPNLPTDRPNTLTPPLTPKQQLVVTNAIELYEASVRILYESISWARNIPTFSFLPLDDQAMLLEYSWSDIFLLNIAQLNVPLKLEYMIELAKEGMVMDGEEVNKEIVNELVHIQDVIQKFKDFNLSSTEYSCVKAIVLFKSDFRRLQSKSHVEKLQEQAQLQLLDLVLSGGQRPRFGNILLKLPLLGEISPSFMEKSFFKGGFDNIGDYVLSPQPSPKPEQRIAADNIVMVNSENIIMINPQEPFVAQERKYSSDKALIKKSSKPKAKGDLKRHMSDSDDDTLKPLIVDRKIKIEELI